MSAMELVYFVFPTCDGKCRHCWSSDMHMGRMMPYCWHQQLIDEIAQEYDFEQIKLSGGEPFLHPELGRIVKQLRSTVKSEVPIIVFTSGRTFVSDKPYPDGVAETKKRIIETLKEFRGVGIHMSVDEFHMQVLCRQRNQQMSQASELFQHYIRNFIEACSEIHADNPEFLSPKLKIHCQKGRMAYHKDELFRWMPQEWWEQYCILTEGLVRSGRAKDLEDSFVLEKDNRRISWFLFPGVDFFPERQSRLGTAFMDSSGQTLYMDSSPDTALIIPGWWSLTNREIESYEKIHLACGAD